MKANSKRALALILAATMSLSACGNTAVEEKPAETPSTPAETTPAAPAAPAETKGEEITDLYLSRLATRELESFNILSCETAAGFENLTNLVDGLLETNPEAQLSPCLATEWGSEDGGLTWNFKLREGVQWVDMNGIWMKAIYHPSALLRDVSKRPETFDDLLSIRQKIQEVKAKV